MKYNHLCLQIKLKHLAFESKLIAAEKHKAMQRGEYGTAQSLHDHRVRSVRPAARHTHLAYGLVRGLPYSAMEKTSHEPPVTAEVLRMAKKYGKGSWDLDCVEKWYAGASVEQIDAEILEKYKESVEKMRFKPRKLAFL